MGQGLFSHGNHAKRHTNHVLAGTALTGPVAGLLLAGTAILAIAGTALADGGQGGAGAKNLGATPGQGGAGGTLGSPNGEDGGDAIDGSAWGAGGGGGGGGGPGGGLGGSGGTGIGGSLGGGGGNGGAGGSGGDHGHDGTSLPVGSASGEVGVNGQAGGDSDHFAGGGGGGGAGGYGAVVSSGGTAAIASGEALSGGGGGAGGGGGDALEGIAGTGGNGGGGGVGLLFTGDALANAGMVIGGDGGTGGTGGASTGGDVGHGAKGGNGGDGGDGGAGIIASNAAIFNQNVIQGGNGGVGGLGGDGDLSDGRDGADGQGGEGVTGFELTVINSGQIAGGTGDSGQANAITFTGGSNRLELRDGFDFTGNVVVESSATGTLVLGGDDNATFDVSTLTDEPLTEHGWFVGFDAFEKTGASVWTLTNETTEVTRWTLHGGTLSISSDAQLGDQDGALTFSGGSLRTTATTAIERAIVLDAAGGTFTVAGVGSTTTLGGSITGAGGLTKTGMGDLILTAQSDYTGGTTVSEGILEVQADGALGTGLVRVDGGGAWTRLFFDGASAGDIELNIDDGLVFFRNGASAGSSTIAIDQETSGATFVASTAGTSNITVHNGSVEFSSASSAGGATITNQDLVVFTDDASAGSANFVNQGQLGFSDSSTLDSAMIVNQSGGIVGFADSSTADGATIVNQAGGEIDLSGRSSHLGIGSLSGDGDVYLGGNDLAIGAIGNHEEIGGVVQDGGLGGGTGGSLTKAGTGTLTLNGANTYTGGTSVQAGNLVVGGPGVSTASILGSVTVENGGTLGGSGTVGDTTIATGGILAPGNSIGTLTVDGDLTLSSGSILDYEIGSSGTTPDLGTSDRIDVAGDLTLNGTLHLSQSNDPADGEAGIGYYRLITYTGDLTDDGLTIVATPDLADPTDYEIQTDSGNVDLFIAASGDDMLQHWQGGDGTWNANDATWLNAGDGAPAGEIAVAWAGNHAVFKNEPGGFDGGTITVEGAQSFSGLQFVDDGFRLEGDGALQTEADGSEIRVLADSAEIATEIAGTGGIAKTQGGTLTLSGQNTYQGGTSVLGGSVQVSEDANLGAVSGGLTLDGGTLVTTADMVSARSVTVSGVGFFDVASATTLDLSGTIDGAGILLIKQGDGTLVLTGTNAYEGDMLVEAGTLVGDAASIRGGNIGNAATLVFDQATTASFAGGIVGLGDTDGAVIKKGAGTLTLNGVSTLDWTVSEGGLKTEAARFGGDVELDGAATALNFADSDNAAYDGAISGDGLFSLDGEGTMLLTGDSSGFAGTTTINSGTLLVGDANGNGTLGGSLDVLDGATLGGSGAVGSGPGSSVTVATGGSLSPGNSIGTLTVDGNLVFAAGSRFAVEVNPEGTDSDLVNVTGTATLDGGSVAQIGADGAYDIRSTYTILSAGTLDGAFEDVTSKFAFLNPDLIYDYDAGTIDLELARNDRDFASAALTRNQIATAEGIESIGFDTGHAVYDAIAQLSDDDELIRASFNALSGEIHASAQTALIEDSRFVRKAANDRIRAAFATAGASYAPVLAYGPEDTPVFVAADHGGPVLWSHGFGSWGSTDGDGNAAHLDRSTGGVLIGADSLVGDWRVGLLAGYSRSSFDAQDRAASGSSSNYHLGLYGGTEWGNVAFRTGAAYTWHDMETSRSVVIPGLTDSLSADYNAGTFQAFGELAYGFELDPGTRFEPFANLAHVSLRTDGFTESGGASALSVDSGATDFTFTTLGLRGEHSLALGTVDATLRGMIGWRNAFGDTTPESTYAFSAGDTFTIAGAPIARNSAVIEAGLDLKLTPESTFGLSYQGQVASDAYDHGFKANLAVRF